MSKINLSPEEFSQIIELFHSELDRAKRRIQHLNTILKRIDDEKINLGTIFIEDNIVKETEEQIEYKRANYVEKTTLTKKAKVGRPKKNVDTSTPSMDVISSNNTAEIVDIKEAKKAKTKRKPLRKSGRSKKIKWGEFILEAISSSKTPIGLMQITAAAQKKFKISEDNSDRVKMVIAGTLTKLSKVEKSIIPYKPEGSKVNFYGLPDWFSNGELLAEFRIQGA